MLKSNNKYHLQPLFQGLFFVQNILNSKTAFRYFFGANDKIPLEISCCGLYNINVHFLTLWWGFEHLFFN